MIHCCINISCTVKIPGWAVLEVSSKSSVLSVPKIRSSSKTCRSWVSFPCCIKNRTFIIVHQQISKLWWICHKTHNMTKKKIDNSFWMWPLYLLHLYILYIIKQLFVMTVTAIRDPIAARSSHRGIDSTRTLKGSRYLAPRCYLL